MSLSGHLDTMQNDLHRHEDLFSRLSKTQTVTDVVDAGDVEGLRHFYAQGLNINIDDGELIATAAERGHLSLLKAMCEEMGGTLKSSKCDYPFFLHGLRHDVRDYVQGRLRFEENCPAEFKNPAPARKSTLSILRIRGSKSQ